MKILNADEIRGWDQYTIQHEPVASIHLMERAALQCVAWLEKNGYGENEFSIFCGKGNNGGDGLAIARLLTINKIPVSVYILEFGHKGTTDFQANLALLHEFPNAQIRFLQSAGNFPELKNHEVIIDALLGSGLNRGLEGVTADLVNHLNNSGNEIISIDVPSGMFVDRSSVNQVMIKADHALSFQCYKPAFLVAENNEFVGDVHILDIGLDPAYPETINAAYEWIDEDMIAGMYKPRNRFSHKGNFGHALLLAGSHGKMGAALLASRSCLRSGAGLLSCHIPACGYSILQTGLPEAMVFTDPQMDFLSKMDYEPNSFESIAIGPGIGKADLTKDLIKQVIQHYKQPIVVDADALNIISEEKELLLLLPPNSVLTPHPKEFDRLFGKCANDFERIQLAIKKAAELNLVIVLKGHHTLIAAPHSETRAYFNSTGNAGMATAGSGDVLTGILAGLIAQGYESLRAAILGTYLHGLAGDLAAKRRSEEAMIAGDIADHIGDAYLQINKWRESGQ